MKKILALALCLAMVLSLATLAQAAPTKMTMGTGGSAGTYYAYGNILSRYMKDFGKRDRSFH